MSTVLVAIAAALVGALLGGLLVGGRNRRREPELGLEAGDVSQIIDLLRRANGAVAACLVAPEAEPTWAADYPPAEAMSDRAASLARLALGDAGEHKVTEAGSVGSDHGSVCA